MVGYGGKDLQKRKVLSLEWKSEGVMGDESGESMEPMEEVPLIQLGEAELENFMKTPFASPHDAVPALEFSSVQFICCEHVKYLKTSLYIYFCQLANARTG